MNPNKIHIFIAVPLPDSMKQVIHEWCQQIRKQLSFKKWIFPDDYHITVKFLGGVDIDTVERLKPAIGEIASKQASFSLSVEGLNTFGKSSSPRILWTNVIGDVKPLHNLQKNIDASMESFGFVPESRSYTPHLTLAKHYSLKAALEANNLEQAVSRQPTSIDWKVSEIVLYQTHLGREPMYESLEKFSFVQSEQ